jgi:hypothetical protein
MMHLLIGWYHNSGAGMRAMVKKGLGLLQAIALPAWFAYVIYGWATYTGAWQWLAEWELQHFGSYHDKATFIALVFAPVLLLSAPLMVIRRQFPATFDGPMPLHPKGVVAGLNKPANAPKVLAVIALGALLAGTVSGWLGYQKSQTPTVFEAIDLARATAPQTRHITISGVAQTGMIVVLEQTFNGNRTEETYLPVTAPNWRKGDPVSFFLMPRGNVYVDDRGAHGYDASSRPFAIAQTGTVFAEGLPGLVRTEFERRGIVMAPATYVLDTKVDADLDVYFGIALASALCLLVIMMTALVLRLKGAKARPS